MGWQNIRRWKFQKAIIAFQFASAVDISVILKREFKMKNFTLLVIETAKIYSSWGASAEPYELHIASAFRVPRDHRDVSPVVSDGIIIFITTIDQNEKSFNVALVS